MYSLKISYFRINILGAKCYYKVVAGDRFDLERPRDASVMEGIRGVFEDFFVFPILCF